MKFTIKNLKEIIDNESQTFVHITTKEIHSSLWANTYEMTFWFNYRRYKVEYRQTADGDKGEQLFAPYAPNQHDNDEIECTEIQIPIEENVDQLIEFIAQRTWERRESLRNIMSVHKLEPRPWDGYDELDIDRFEYGRAHIKSIAGYVARKLLKEYDVTIKK